MYKCSRCSKPASEGVYCSKHAATAMKERKRERKGHHSLYSSRRWRSLRELALSDQPLCQCCAYYGLTVPSVDVDHIWPVSLCPDLSYTRSNLQTLCKSCHSSKTAQEKRGLIVDYPKGTITNVETGELRKVRAQ